MKIHADVTRIPATRKRVSSRDVFWASRKATIGTAVRHPSQLITKCFEWQASFWHLIRPDAKF